MVVHLILVKTSIASHDGITNNLAQPDSARAFIRVEGKSVWTVKYGEDGRYQSSPFNCSRTWDKIARLSPTTLYKYLTTFLATSSSDNLSLITISILNFIICLRFITQTLQTFS